MKIDKDEYKKVIIPAKNLEFNYFKYKSSGEPNVKSLIVEEEVEFLINNDIYHEIMNSSKKSKFSNKIILDDGLKEEYELLKKYVLFFESMT